MTSQNPKVQKGDLSRSNHPFIWGNIALLAGVPWLLALSMAGLAVGDPVFPEWFEIFILGFPAIALVAWVQWQQPISPFSLWFVAKPSESLSDRDRQILTLVKQHSNGWYVTGWIATAVALVMGAIFCKIYISAPLAQAIAPFPAGLRLFGIVWAEICFLLSNILLQSGISALRIKLTADSELIGLQPFATEKIKNSFTNIGWHSPRILKFFEEDTAIADTTEDLIAEPTQFIEDAEVGESWDSTEAILEPEIETIPHEEIIQESEELEPIEFFVDPEPEGLDIADAPSELEIEPEILDVADTCSEAEPETNTEVTDISLDNDFVEEIEELEISAIVAEESVIEAISEPEIEIEQFVEEPQIETILNQEIVPEPEELNPFELVEDENSDLGAVLEATENESNLDEKIAEEAEELEAFETPEEPDLTFLEISDTSSEPKFEEPEQVEANLEFSEAVLEEQFTDDREELESLETIEDADAEEVSDPTITSQNRRSIDFLKKSRKTASASKKHGFGKPIKRDASNLDNLDAESAPDHVPAIAEIETIATPIEHELDVAEITTQDFDDELDEMITFNAYVENILQEYLEDSGEESEEIEDNLENTVEIADIPPAASELEPVEQVLVDPESFDQEISEPIAPSIVFDPAVEAIAIAKESVESFTENLPDVEAQIPADITEEIPRNEPSPKNPEYWVQELLVDKFFARIEALNIADKANKAAIEQPIENISEPDPEIDEFADLEALLDRKPENTDADDLSDRNS